MVDYVENMKEAVQFYQLVPVTITINGILTRGPTVLFWTKSKYNSIIISIIATHWNDTYFKENIMGFKVKIHNYYFD